METLNMGCFATSQVLSAYEKQFSVAKAVSGKEGGEFPETWIEVCLQNMKISYFYYYQLEVYNLKVN